PIVILPRSIRRRAPVAIVHVGDDQPTSIGVLPKSECELAHVRLPFLPRETADDVPGRSIRRESKGSQDEWAARSFVVALNRIATTNRRRSVRQEKTVLGEQARQRGAVTLSPGRFVVG